MPKQSGSSSGLEVPMVPILAANTDTNKKDLLPPAPDKRSDGRSSPKSTSHVVVKCNIPRHRFLSQAEWTIFAHGVGAIHDAEHQMPIHPRSWWWPPRGLPRGLYRDAVYHRAKSFYLFHLASIMRWILMILQLFLGATLTALGSFSLQKGTSITVLGATNTVAAGCLAFLHNSGLPDRYWYDMAEYEEVEDHIREILDTSMILADRTLDQALAECFHLYQNAKATVMANKPLTYTTGQARQGIQTGRRSIPVIPPTAATALSPTTGKSPQGKISGGSEAGAGSSEK